MLNQPKELVNQRFNQTFVGLIALLFLAAPLYYQINPGGEGLLLPFNSMVWLVVSFIIGLGIFSIIQRNQLQIPSITLAMMFFLATTTLLGIINSVVMPEAWLFRSLALWGGILFYLAICQFNLNTRTKDLLLLLLLFSAATQAVIGILQILLVESPITWLPHSPGVPRAIFQQPNISATYAATGVLIGLYSVTRPSFLSRTQLLQAAVWIALGLCLTTIVTSGSRIGILSVAIGGVLLLLCRNHYWRLNPKQFFILLLVICSFGFAANQLPSEKGISGGLEKMARATDSTQDVRIMMYDSTWQLVKERPVLGYGIGQFQPIWHEKKAEYIQQNPGAAILQPRLSHPHNEILYWSIEGGLAAVIGILVMALTYLWRACQLGWQRGASYIALALPIAAHTQVELPFYISQLHWIVFVFLISLVGTHRIRRTGVNISSMARATILALAVMIPLTASIFTAKNLTSLHMTMNFITGKDKSIENLRLAGENLYFSRWITAINMQIIFQAGYKTDDKDILQSYVNMARDYLQYVPEVQVMTNLSLALHKLGEYDPSHSALYKAARMYPTNPVYIKAQNQIIELDREKGIFDRYWKASPQAK